MNSVKCTRCGHEIKLTFKKAGKMIKCNHCNLVMKQDKKTEKRLFIAKVAYAAVFIMIVSLIYSMFSGKLDNTISILIILGAGLASAGTSDYAANFIVFKLFGKSYQA
ncbi:MAG: hypothetical protein VB009_05630 [Erysipelotrichaceae bacterium]|nr:hypothetical protein [Erysipelotrichaceae bacterium]